MTTPEFSPCAVVPEGYSALAFSCELADGWVRVPLPAEETDFSNSAIFAPLLIVSAPYAAVVFTVAARPRYDDGSVEDWANYLAEQNNLKVERMQEARIARSPAVLVNATMESEAGPMRTRSVFLEDGGRLFNIGTLAPEQIWPSVEPLLQRMIGSFRLDEMKGLTAAPMREMSSGETVDLTWSSADDAASAPEIAESSTSASMVAETASAEGAPTVEAEPDVALADDASSLDPENSMNVRLRDSGAGLTVRVLEVDLKTKRATIGAGAIEAVIRVPLGWHVIDDGRRTLVFDAPGKMQINLNLRSGTSEEHFAILEGIGDELAAANPTAEFLRVMLKDYPCLAIRKLNIDGELLQQAYIVRASRRPDLALVCRVTADDDNIDKAMNTVMVILESYAEELMTSKS